MIGSVGHASGLQINHRSAQQRAAECGLGKRTVYRHWRLLEAAPYRYVTAPFRASRSGLPHLPAQRLPSSTRLDVARPAAIGDRLQTAGRRLTCHGSRHNVRPMRRPGGRTLPCDFAGDTWPPASASSHRRPGRVAGCRPCCGPRRARPNAGRNGWCACAGDTWLPVESCSNQLRPATGQCRCRTRQLGATRWCGGQKRPKQGLRQTPVQRSLDVGSTFETPFR